MVINTTRFGPLEIMENQVLHIAGIAGEKAGSDRFILVEMPSTDAGIWLQSVDNAEFAIRLVDPSSCVPGFKLPTNRHVVELMRTSRNGELHAYLVLERSGDYLVVNIDEPIVINKHSRRGLHLHVELTEQLAAESAPVPQAPARPSAALPWRNRWSDGLDMGRSVHAVA